MPSAEPEPPESAGKHRAAQSAADEMRVALRSVADELSQVAAQLSSLQAALADYLRQGA
jgi:hypothetical protein